MTAKYRKGRPRRSLSKSCLSQWIAGDSKTVVGILKFWRDAGAGGAAGDFNVVAPGSSAGGFARRLHRALFGAARIVLGRGGVVVRVVPVAAPFVDIVANIVKAEGVGSVAGDGLGASLPARGIVGERLRRGVAPGKMFLFEAAAGGEFPFGFRGQAIGAAGLRTQPFAVASGFVPRDPVTGC